MDLGHAVSDVNFVAVLVAALSNFILGGLWYSRVLLGKPWMEASGMTEEKAKEGNMPRIFGVAFILEIIAAFVLAMFIGADAGFHFGAMAGFHVGLFWVGGGLGVIYLFEQRPLKLWLVNAGYMTVAFTLMGAILGAWS
jgi:hypothetical protein